MSTDKSGKATPRPYYKLVETEELSKFELHCGYEDFWVPHFEINYRHRILTHIYARDTLQRMVETLNTYNPDRDKLARELAEMVEGLSTGCLNYEDCELGHIQEAIDKACQLLKLYKEE